MDAVREGLRVEGVGQTRLVRVRYTAHDPDLAAAIINAASAAYGEYSAERARQQARQRRNFIEARLNEIADSLAIAQEALVGYQERSGQLPPEIEGDVTVQALMTAESEVRSVRFQESLLENLLASLETGDGAVDALPRILALSGSLLPVGKDLYERLQELRTERRKLTSSDAGYTEQSPQVETVDSLIAATHAEVGQVAGQSLDMLRQRSRTLESRIAELRAQVGDLPTQVAAYTRLKQRVDAVQEVYNLLIDKYWEAQIAEASAEGNVQVVEAAAVPVEPDPSHAARTLIFALMLGLFIGVGGAVGWDAVDPKVRDVEDVETAADVAVLGTIPPLERANSGRPPPLPAAAPTEGPQLEAFRILQTSLRFARTRHPRRLAVTSAGPREGKTLVAANLAVILARQGARVLLIDADLRRPTLHRTFGFEREPGLTDLLVGRASVKQAIRSWSGGRLGGRLALRSADGPGDEAPADADADVGLRLDLLPAGARSPLPAELLGSEPFATLLKSAEGRYDAVIVDTPPVLPVADAVLVGRACDAIVVVARAGTTNRYALARTLEQLRGIDRAALGVVLNDIAPRAAYPGYGYKDYYTYASSDAE
jgi:Mrp family chromosome partitioning ATPase